MFSAVEKKDMPLNKNINYFYLKFVYVSLLGYDEVLSAMKRREMLRSNNKNKKTIEKSLGFEIVKCKN